MSCLASLGLIAATVYSLRIIQKVFLGNKNTDWKMHDLTIREKTVSAALVIAIVWLGLFPQPVLDIAKPAILKTLNKQNEITLQNPVSNPGQISMILLPPSQPSPKGEIRKGVK
jgi:NADH-quinone oxidoreductase subunit M